MRIISDFHDYYDVVQATGQDQQLIYMRRREETEIRTEYPFPCLGSRWFYWRYEGPHCVVNTIGLCGKIYPVIGLRKKAEGEQDTLCVNIEDVDRFVEGDCGGRAYEEYLARPRRRDRLRHWWRGVQRSDFENLFAEFEEKKERFSHLFLGKLSPIFVATRVIGESR
jgi:hypothetical protein